ncbi:MAG: hypothetical protein JXA07_10840 [Spirochaetes bacterium]|nr:hypothetical protein [Spirochaetota bacterium]
MKKKIIPALLVTASMLCIGASAMALGIGAYIEAAGGESYRSVRSKSLDSTGGKITAYGFKAGFIFDTCVACDSSFSYRLKIGGGMSWADLMSQTNFNGFYLSNTFALAAVKNDYVKFWIGPQIGFSYRRGSSDRLFFGTDLPGASYLALFSSDFTPPLYYQAGAFKERVKYNIFGADAGLAFGVNLHLGELASLSLEAGVKYGYGIGRQDRELYNIRGVVPYNRFKSDRLMEHGVEGYGSFAFMFRFVDTYQ